MASRKDPKAKENQARKPVAQKAVADTSGSNLADFKNKAADIVTGGIAKAVLGPLSNMMSNQGAAVQLASLPPGLLSSSVSRSADFNQSA